MRMNMFFKFSNSDKFIIRIYLALTLQNLNGNHYESNTTEHDVPTLQLWQPMTKQCGRRHEKQIFFC